MKVYGFALGEQIVDIEAQDECAALKILANKFWYPITLSGNIELLGEMKTISELADELEKGIAKPKRKRKTGASSAI